ncbi:MAG: FG-GAP-like repeat-containing protein, partial [Verrucomicrobiota bacterium]
VDVDDGATPWFNLSCQPNFYDLSVTNISPNKVFTNEVFDYTIVIYCEGFGVASGLLATNTLPPGVSFVSSSLSCVVSNQQVICLLPDVEAGRTNAFTITVKAPGTTGTISNHVAVTANADEFAPDNNTHFLESQVLDRPFTVQSTSPRLGAQDIAPDASILVSFYGEVDTSTIDADSFIVRSRWHGEVAGSLSFPHGQVRFNPTEDFTRGDRVEVYLGNTIQSLTGSNLQAHAFSFRIKSLGCANYSLTDSGQALGTGTSVRVAIGDLDGDDDLDIVTIKAYDFTRAVQIWLNNGLGQMTLDTETLFGGPLQQPALGDLDRDGDLDLVITVFNAPNRVFFNNGNGQFTDSGQFLGFADSWGLCLADFDGDGDLDVHFANDQGGSRVWLNIGAGFFTDSGQSLGSSPRSACLAADFDGDGDMDIYYGAGSSSDESQLWLNDGHGVFTNALWEGVGCVEAAILGDVNGDGQLDVVSMGGDLGVWATLNNGDGTFGGDDLDFDDYGSVGGDLGDLDGDCDLDLIITNNDRYETEIRRNNGSGRFNQNGPSIIPEENNDARFVDFDGDGDLDLLLVQQANGDRIYFN